MPRTRCCSDKQERTDRQPRDARGPHRSGVHRRTPRSPITVKSLGNRLLGAADPPRRPIEFIVVQDDAVNAFAMIGGHIGPAHRAHPPHAQRVGARRRRRPRNRAHPAAPPVAPLPGPGEVPARVARRARPRHPRLPRQQLPERTGHRGRHRGRERDHGAGAARLHARARARGRPRGRHDARARRVRPARHGELLRAHAARQPAQRVQERALVPSHPPAHGRAHRGHAGPRGAPGRAARPGQLRVPPRAREAARRIGVRERTSGLFRNQLADRTVLRPREEVYGLAFALRRAREIAEAEKESPRSAPAKAGTPPSSGSRPSCRPPGPHRRRPDTYRAAHKAYPSTAGSSTAWRSRCSRPAATPKPSPGSIERSAPRPTTRSSTSCSRAPSRQRAGALPSIARRPRRTSAWETSPAVDQLELATKVRDSNFYELSMAEARLRELRSQLAIEREAEKALKLS